MKKTYYVVELTFMDGDIITEGGWYIDGKEALREVLAKVHKPLNFHVKVEVIK